MQKAPERLPTNRRRSAHRHIEIERAGRCPCPIEQVLGFIDEKGPRPARVVGKRREMRDQLRIFVEERRKVLVTNPSAQEPAVTVARIVHEREVEVSDVRFDLGPSTVDKRSDHSVGAVGIDPGEPRQRRPAQQSAEHRLRLIVLRVAHRHPVRLDPCGEFEQCTVARIPGFRLKGRAGTEADAERMEGKPEPFTEFAHPGDFLAGFGSKPVVDGGHHQRKAEFGGQRRERMGHCHRIGAERAGAHDPIPGRHQGAVDEGPTDPGDQHAEPYPMARRLQPGQVRCIVLQCAP